MLYSRRGTNMVANCVSKIQGEEFASKSGSLGESYRRTTPPLIGRALDLVRTCLRRETALARSGK